MNTTQKIKSVIFFTLIISFLFVSCGNDAENDLLGGNQNNVKLPGTIYWHFAGDVGYIDFTTGKATAKKMPMGSSSSRFDAYDISWDNKKILLTLDVEGSFNFHERRFILRNNTDNIQYKDLTDGQNLRDFIYEWDDIKTTYAYISPNEKYLAIAAQHFSDMPLTILNAETGAFVSNWLVKGVSFLHYGDPVWTADNTVYFRIGNNVYKSSPSDGYQSAPRVLASDKTISNVTVNPQGTKFVFRMDKHLWMCNIDGSDLRQITTCETFDFIDYDGESHPTFSPDGKYIAFKGAAKRGTPWSDHDYPDGSWVAVTGGRYGYIVVIPADGKLYDLESKDSGAIWLKEPGKNTYGVASSGRLIWR